MAKKKKLQESKSLPPERPESPIPEEDEPKMGEDEDELELISKIESILFCVPEGVTVNVLANKLNLGLKGDVEKLLLKLKQNYDYKAGGIKLVQDGESWKFKIPDEHTELVKEAAIPEFDLPILETLAYIAWRNGSRQCDVVRVRSNKAYNHIKLLKEKGFIESHKSGLSKWLQPTKKFYEYFKIDPCQKLPVPEEVEKKLRETGKAPEETKAQEDDEEPGDDEPDSGSEPGSEEQEDDEGEEE